MLCRAAFVTLVAASLARQVLGAHSFRQDLYDNGLSKASFSATGSVSPLAQRAPQSDRPAPHFQAQSTSAGSEINVQTFGAKGDGITDDTSAFAEALSSCSAAGGGLVYAPPGQYYFKGNLTIPSGVTLKGSYQVVPSHDLRGARWPNMSLDDGSILIPAGGRGIPCDLDCVSAFITVQANGVLQGFSVLYKEQEREATPVPYPWTVFMTGANAAVMDVELLGSWNGIAAVAAHRHYIARVQGQPINIGVFVDETYDIGRLEDVHFNPWFSSAKPFIYYQTMYGRAFVMGRSDWEYVFNTFAFAYAIGYHFIERATGSMNGNFLGIGMDLATNASVQVDQSQPYGILITNGEFTAFCDNNNVFCTPGVHTPRHVVVGHQNTGAVKFVNSAFWGPAAQIAKTAGTGVVTFSQCHFDDWDNYQALDGKSNNHKGSPAITQEGGSLILAMNEFTGGHTRNRSHLGVGRNATKTIFTNNMITGTLLVKRNSEAKGKMIVANNADDSAQDDESGFTAVI